MFATQQNTSLLIGTAQARGGASGIDTGTGSAAENQGEIAQKGKYAAALDLWQGQNQATAEMNKAAGLQYSRLVDAMGGNAAATAADYSAVGTLASSGASAYKIYSPNGPTPPTGAGPLDADIAERQAELERISSLIAEMRAKLGA